MRERHVVWLAVLLLAFLAARGVTSFCQQLQPAARPAPSAAIRFHSGMARQWLREDPERCVHAVLRR